MRQDRLQFLRPAAVHSSRACARASANGGNRFTWISIIVIKHAASMNYLFVGRVHESKKRKKEELALEEERKKKHVSESITKIVRCLHPFPAGW